MVYVCVCVRFVLLYISLPKIQLNMQITIKYAINHILIGRDIIDYLLLILVIFLNNSNSNLCIILYYIMNAK